MQLKYLAACLCAVGTAAAGCGGSAPGAAAHAAAAQKASPGLAGLPAILNSGQAASASGPADASLTGIHACKLVSAAVIRSVLGALSEPAYESPGGQGCFYEPAVPGGVGPTVIVTVLERSGFEAAESFVEGVEQTDPAQANFVKVSGLGDGAYATSNPAGPDYELAAAVGGRAVNISVGSTAAVNEHQVRELMTAALSHL